MASKSSVLLWHLPVSYQSAIILTVVRLVSSVLFSLASLMRNLVFVDYSSQVAVSSLRRFALNPGSMVAYHLDA